jgi:hypothetical protein
MTRSLRAVAALLVAGLCCVLAALLLPGSADADTSHDVEVSVAGGPFVPFSTSPLLDTSTLAPGRSTAAILGVRSGMHQRAELFLRMYAVHDDDNGCAPPESAVDTTCGRGEGDLGRLLTFTLETADEQDGQYTPIWSGTANQLEGAVNTDLTLLPQDTRWVRMTAALPADAGAQVESDSFGFALSAILRGKSGSGETGIGGEHTHKHHHGTDGAGPLADTGVAMTLLAGAGVLLIVVGLLVLATALRRTRRRAAGSDEGRHRVE